MATNKLTLLVVAIFVLYTVVTFAYYVALTLNGDVNNFIMSADRFGLPKESIEHGLTPYYTGAATGWDGQFYFSMANDLLGRGDAPQYIDTPAYRYQRIGFALFVAIIAKVLFLGWVSPITYLITYFALVLAATVAGAQLFKRLGLSPLWILLWSLSVGTQITMMAALPDAAADAFLIIAFFLLFKKRYVWAALPFTFAMLSREAYVIFPVMILLVHAVQLLLRDNPRSSLFSSATVKRLFAWHRFYALVVPAVAFVGWQAYVTHHFGMRPSSQAFGINGKPFVSWWNDLQDGLAGNHRLAGIGKAAHWEAMALICFMVVVVVTIALAVRVVISRKLQMDADVRGFAISIAVLGVLYASFGPTVTSYYTGYIKAIALFFFAIPFFVAGLSLRAVLRAVVLVITLIPLVLTSYYRLTSNVFIPAQLPFRYSQQFSAPHTETLACAPSVSAKVEVENIEIHDVERSSELLGRGNWVAIRVKVTNLGTQPMVSTNGSRSYSMSYQWLDAAGTDIPGAVRTAFVTDLQPNASQVVTAVSFIPKDYQQRRFVLSPVQELCNWFVDADPQKSNYPVVTLPAGID